MIPDDSLSLEDKNTIH